MAESWYTPIARPDGCGKGKEAIPKTRHDGVQSRGCVCLAEQTSTEKTSLDTSMYSCANEDSRVLLKQVRRDDGNEIIFSLQNLYKCIGCCIGMDTCTVK